MAKKWRECTTIPDYEFDPDGKYDGSLYKEDWDEIFNDLYRRAETTEDWRYNDWIDPLSTRNAYTEYFKDKAGNDYIVLKYYDGMYALYEIKDESEITENVFKTARIIEKIESGVSVRQAIYEASVVKSKVFEDVVGMIQETYDDFIAKLDKWTGGSGKNGWEYETVKNNDMYSVKITKNPITDFDYPVMIEMAGNIINGEVHYEPTDEYFAASAQVSFSGLKSVLRDLTSQVEMAQADQENDSDVKDTGNIYGY